MGVKNDLICAVATGAGVSAIAVVRLSGEGAIATVEAIFNSPSGRGLLTAPPNTIHFGAIVDGDDVIDEVLISIFHAPHSFTGEESVEISCHGSRYIQSKILELLIERGARLAEPGEFTKRAFLNGKMDLSEAEAVADLISSESEAAHRVSISQMRGGFSSELEHLREQLLELTSLLELELDFSEEDVEFADRERLRAICAEIERRVATLCDSFRLGNVIKNGIPVAIVGPTNAGKSTLLNALLHDDRAIVSEVPGTTRDTIEDVALLGGVAFRFIDTAGIRQTEERVENLGIERTFDKIANARIVLLLLPVDGENIVAQDEASHGGALSGVSDSERVSFEDYKRRVLEAMSDGATLITLHTKIDKIPADEREQLRKTLLDADSVSSQELRATSLQKPSREVAQSPLCEVAQGSAGKKTIGESLCISAKTGEGMAELLELLTAKAEIKKIASTDTIVTNMRHYEELKLTLDAIKRVSSGIERSLSGELVAQDLREALFHLGSINGAITSDEILSTIFSRFCIGK